MNLAKYLILAAWPAGNEPERAIIFDRAIQHSAMVPHGTRPVSAGFVIVHAGQLHIPAIDSESLHLGPRPADLQILSALINTPIHGGVTVTPNPETVPTVSHH